MFALNRGRLGIQINSQVRFTDWFGECVMSLSSSEMRRIFCVLRN